MCRQPHAQLPAEACFDVPYVVLHPMPRYAYKAWPSNNWSALVRRLNDAGLKVVLTGGNNASELAAIRDIVPEGADAVILAGKLSFGQTAELIARSKGFVGPDTGTTHVASSTGVPIVTLFGPSDPTAWGPGAGGRQSHLILGMTACHSGEAMSSFSKKTASVRGEWVA